MSQPSDFKIMVVDDEPDLSEAIAFDLKRKGYQVTTAESGNAAFQLLQRDPVDLIISDVRMADGDGIELLNRVKAKDAFRPVVIFITGFADISIEEAYEKGADAIFSKPFERKALFEAIERALQSPEARFFRNGSRAEADLPVTIRFLDSGFELKGRARNIAKGGMFVEISGRLPALEKCEFAIESGAPVTARIKGEGFVRWKREQSANGFPTGIGIEFLELDPASAKDMIAVVNYLKTKSFIPRK